MHCTLLVTGLLPAALRDAPPRTPCLQTLLARGDAVKASPRSIEEWLGDAFGVASQPDLPAAALTLSEVGGTAAGGDYWLRCDPVHQHVQQNRLHLAPAGTLSPDETASLIAALNAHFQEDGLHFHGGAAGRWYVRSKAHTAIATQPLQRALHHAVDKLMPTGADSGYWRRVLNEVQMLLHAHPVNAAREARGEPAANSVWLWGGGCLPPAGRSAFTKVWSDEALARALGRHSGSSVSALPASTQPVLAAGGNALVVPSAIADAGVDYAAWHAGVEAFETTWATPCLAALKQGQLEGITLVTYNETNRRCIRLTRNHLWRWWRRPRALDRHE